MRAALRRRNFAPDVTALSSGRQRLGCGALWYHKTRPPPAAAEVQPVVLGSSELSVECGGGCMLHAGYLARRRSIRRALTDLLVYLGSGRRVKLRMRGPLLRRVLRPERTRLRPERKEQLKQ